jgi:hypothetical protein
MAGDWTIAYTIETSDSRGKIFGVSDASTGQDLQITNGQLDASSGQQEIFIRDSSGSNVDLDVHTNSTWNDGGTYRVQILVGGNGSPTGSDIDIYVWDSTEDATGSAEATTTTRDDGVSTWSDFTDDVYSHGVNFEGSLNNPINAVLDNIVIDDKKWAQANREADLANQPWSAI